MDWLCQDWEHEALKDDIYLMEYKMEIEWQQWEYEQVNRLPAIIKIEKPILINETERNTRTVRGAHQTRL